MSGLNYPVTSLDEPTPPTLGVLGQGGPDWLLPVFQLATQCQRRLREELAKIAERHAMTEPEFHLLWYCSLARSRPPSQNDLAQGLAISPAQVSGLVEELRQKQWIAGHRAPTDRRRQVWQLTELGTSILISATREASALASQVLGYLTRDEQDVVLQSLSCLGEALRRTTLRTEECA